MITAEKVRAHYGTPVQFVKPAQPDDWPYPHAWVFFQKRNHRQKRQSGGRRGIMIAYSPLTRSFRLHTVVKFPNGYHKVSNRPMDAPTVAALRANLPPEAVAACIAASMEARG